MTENMKTKAFKRRGGCDEDCMNCPYPDCYKPTMECKTDTFVSALLRERPSKEKSALLTDLIYQENFIYEGCTMINFIIGLIIGAPIGFAICAILSANGRD